MRNLVNACLFWGSLFACNTQAATNLSLGTQGGLLGAQVVIPVTLSSDESVVGLQLDVVYDANQLDSLAVNGGADLGSDHVVRSSNTVPGTHRVLVFSEQNTPIPNGEVVTVTFGIAQGATPGPVTVNMSGVLIADPNATSISADSLENGSVVVQDQSAVVQNRLLFYNDSAFDSASNANAIATDKSALLPGNVAVFANYTSYSHGINGIMVDLAGVPNLAGITAADFTFKVGNSNTPASWTAAPAPSSVSTEQGAGTGGADRVTIEWANNAIQKQWLEVTVLANGNTGLAANDVFYFGNAVGEAGNSASDASTDVSDEIRARNNPRSIFNPAPIDFPYDYNRDGKVDVTDEILARNNGTSVFTALRLIDLTQQQSNALTTASVNSRQIGRISLESRADAPGGRDSEESGLKRVTQSIQLFIRPSEFTGELVVETREPLEDSVVLQLTDTLDGGAWREPDRDHVVIESNQQGGQVWRLKPVAAQSFFRLKALDLRSDF